MNQFKVSNRTVKAMKLAEVLRRAGCDSEAAMHLPEDGWKVAELAAGTRPSSEITRELVASFLKAEELAANSDPFAGLPS